MMEDVKERNNEILLAPSYNIARQVIVLYARLYSKTNSSYLAI